MREPDNDDLGPEPLVSVCVPTFNRAAYIQETVKSALEQTYERIELVVADDRSDDSTAALVKEFSGDPRLRLLENPTRLGHVPNRNRVAAAARGSLVKFLDDDDLLEPTCVEKMVSRFQRDPGVGFVFCRRRLISETGEDVTQELEERFGAPHRRFNDLQEVNEGESLFRQCVGERPLRRNWIGEPVAVMMSRELLGRSGGFNSRVHFIVDVDLWLRVLPHTRVGFIDEYLASYRVGHASVTEANRTNERDWLDVLWILEGLWEQPEIRARFPIVGTLLAQERRQAWRTVAKLGRGEGGRRVPPGEYLPYLVMRIEKSLPGFAQAAWRGALARRREPTEDLGG